MQIYFERYIVIKFAYFGKYIRKTRKVLKCGARGG
jgi:hypothetical protein